MVPQGHDEALSELRDGVPEHGAENVLRCVGSGSCESCALFWVAQRLQIELIGLDSP